MLYSTLIIFSSILGALGAFQLQKLGFSAVVASCIIGLLGALVSKITSNNDIALVVFAGSFVGMTASSVGSYPMITLAGLISGILFLLLSKEFLGYGGKLGTIAFISVVSSLLVIGLFKLKDIN